MSAHNKNVRSGQNTLSKKKIACVLFKTIKSSQIGLESYFPLVLSLFVVCISDNFPHIFFCLLFFFGQQHNIDKVISLYI
jgi:hypothetical protein